LIVLSFSSTVIATLTVPANSFFSTALFYFILGGILGPCFGQLFLFVGINRVGSSIAAPLHDTKSLFAALSAVIILNEKLTFSIAVATLAMVVGSAIISSEVSGGQIEKRWTKKDLIFPILAGAFFGLSHVIRKMGLTITPEPILGVAVQNVAALTFFLLITIAQRSSQILTLGNRRAWVFFGFCGLSTLVGQICIYIALDLGHVTIVSPLSSATPIFVLLLGAVFLKQIEKVTWKIILGTIFIVAATIVLTLAS
jgi:uncharacterized membrane protein